MDAFERQCMPFLEGCFLSHSDSIIAIMKTVQMATRSLQVTHALAGPRYARLFAARMADGVRGRSARASGP